VEVFSADAQGEDQVHGSVAPWLAWIADFAAGPGISGPATIVVAAPNAVAAGEPWFVRVRDYPALGSALAWDRPKVLASGTVLRRRFEAAIADGRLTEAEVRQLADDLIASRS
jgi:Methane oxygenase PmoA